MLYCRQVMAVAQLSKVLDEAEQVGGRYGWGVSGDGTEGITTESAWGRTGWVRVVSCWVFPGWVISVGKLGGEGGSLSGVSTWHGWSGCEVMAELSKMLDEAEQVSGRYGAGV
jgi:hypothetical protein